MAASIQDLVSAGVALNQAVTVYSQATATAAASRAAAVVADNQAAVDDQGRAAALEALIAANDVFEAIVNQFRGPIPTPPPAPAPASP